jgi:phytoene dehydrogenase-like protein
MEEGSRARMLFDFVAGDIQWHPMPDVYDRFVYPGLTFDVPKGAATHQQALMDKFPDEIGAISQYFRDIRKAVGFATRNMISGSLPPTIAALIRIGNRATSRLALMTTREYLDDHFEDPLLKALLASQWMDYGLPPSNSAFAIHALIVSHYLGGAWYPEGGSGVIAEGAQRIIESAGGKVLINHEVERVIVEGGRAVGVDVRLKGRMTESPVRFNAPVVVSDAGAWNTFTKLLPPSVNVPFLTELNELTSARHPGCAVVTLYLGLDRHPGCMGFRGENYWIFEGLDHDAMLSKQDELLDGVLRGCYLSFPSLKESGAKHHTAEIIAPLSYASLEKFRDEPWRRRSEPYRQMKDNMSRAMLNAVDRHYPDFSKMVVFSELSTPLTTEHFTAHPRGSIYGVPATPERYRKSWLKPDTPLKNLYLTGADAGCLGIMGALMGGVSAAARIIGPMGLFSIMAAAAQNRAKSASAMRAAPQTTS